MRLTVGEHALRVGRHQRFSVRFRSRGTILILEVFRLVAWRVYGCHMRMMLAHRRRSSEPSGETDTLTPGCVVLPSGRVLDLYRSRWDGVLDPEEYEYCRQHGVALGV